MPSIPDNLSTVIVLIVGLISHGLRGDNLPRGTNVALAAASCIVAALATFWLVGGFETAGSARETVLTFIIFTGLMTGKELLALFNYLEDAPSPLAKDRGSTP